MTVELTHAESCRLADALRECIEIARTYRHSIGDEDSIVLLRNLDDMARMLALPAPGTPS